MKVFVVHDAKGTIISYAIPAPEMEGQLGIEPAPGQSVSEVEVSELDQIEDVRERLRQLDETLRDRRVQDGKLVPHQDGG
jgi:hypothetical protein